MNPKLVMALGVLVSVGSACSSSPTERPMSGFGQTTAGSGGSSSGSAGDDKGSINPLPTFGTGGTFATGTGTGTGGGGDKKCADGSSTALAVTFRDFNEKHPDFERSFAGDVVRRKLVDATLGTDQKPAFLSSTGCPFKEGTPLACDNWDTPKPVITSAETFNQWYRTVDGVNYELKKEIKLEETTNGSGQYVFESSAFFPLGKDEGFGITPAGNDLGKNFLFTTEIHVRFQYVTGQKFTFRGDDDLWIFVNGKLALDLGSTHAAAEGVIDFDEQAGSLGLTAFSSYPMDIFHAERHTRDSNFKLTTNISCFEPGAIVN